MKLNVHINGEVKVMTQEEFNEIQAKADATFDEALKKYLASEEGQLDEAFAQTKQNEMKSKRRAFTDNFKSRKGQER